MNIMLLVLLMFVTIIVSFLDKEYTIVGKIWTKINCTKEGYQKVNTELIQTIWHIITICMIFIFL